MAAYDPISYARDVELAERVSSRINVIRHNDLQEFSNIMYTLQKKERSLNTGEREFLGKLIDTLEGRQ